MLDLTNISLKNCSPYIHLFEHDEKSKKIILECVDNQDNFKPLVRLTFSTVTDYKEVETDSDHEDSIDSIIGISLNKAGAVFIQTEYREYQFYCAKEPIIERLA